MKVSMYVAASMDGFIARPDGAIDWLGPADAAEGDYGYPEFYASVDVLVMGGNTYRQMLASPDWPYAGKPVWVYSRSGISSAPPGVRRADSDPAALVERLRSEGMKHLWVLGGGDIHSLFLRQGLIDEIRLFIVSLALGRGVPLFAPPLEDRRWTLAEARRWNREVAELRYVNAAVTPPA